MCVVCVCWRVHAYACLCVCACMCVRVCVSDYLCSMHCLVKIVWCSVMHAEIKMKMVPKCTGRITLSRHIMKPMIKYSYFKQCKPLKYIFIDFKRLKYSPGIAPEELFERCWDVWDHRMDMTSTSRRCPMTSHTFSVPVFSSSLEFFLLLHYCQAKCIIYCLTLNPAHGFILMTNAAIQK